ncbi:MAG: energy-coupling factor transporter ATPase [Clostridia bacterium]|nr:energy-coupling factor transporter ATPase [Clostridia bacterium]
MSEEITETVLEIKNLTYKYSVGTPFEKVALSNISFSVSKGDFLAVIGHTGSGKSTLIQHFNALLEPASGQVLLDGKDINADKITRRDARFKVGLCFQYPEYQLFESTVYDDIAFGPGNMGLGKEEIDARVKRAAEFVGLTSAMLKKSPFDLSGGEKRRAAIAGVMAMEPEILVLDEPAAGLDPVGRRNMLELIKTYRKRTGSTVIIVSHSMEDVALCAEKVLVLSNGEVAMYDRIENVFSQAETLRRIGLNVPLITDVFRRLKELGYDVSTDIFTLDRATEELVRVYKEAAGK